jgi:hypothetical protein
LTAKAATMRSLITACTARSYEKNRKNRKKATISNAYHELSHLFPEVTMSASLKEKVRNHRWS